MLPVTSSEQAFKFIGSHEPMTDVVLAVVLIVIFAVLAAGGVAMTSRLDRRRHQLVQARREGGRPQR